MSIGVLRVIALSLIWGSSFLWTHLALEAFNPVQITWGRLVLGALVLALIVRGRLVTLIQRRDLFLPLAIAATLATAAPYFLFALSQQYIPSNLAGALNATTPIWTLTLALVFRTQRSLSTTQLGGLLLGLAGTLIILSPWDSATTSTTLLGSAFALLAAASYGAGYVYIAARITPVGLPPSPLAAAQMLMAAALVTPVIPVAGLQAPSLAVLPVIAIVILGVGGTGLAYVLLYRIISDDGPVAAAAVTYLLSVVAVLLGVLILDDPLTISLGIGAVMVVVGVALSRKEARVGTAES